MYKDKDKQREANAERQRRYKAKQKALLNKGVTQDINEIPKGVTKPRLIPGSPSLPSLGLQEHCRKVYAVNFPKRGKDIKCFADLPPDVQQTIDEMSMVDGKIDQTVKVNRTAIAVNYQHLFPDRYYSTGVA